MIEQVFAATSFGFAVGAALMALSNRKVSVQVARERWKKLVVYFLIVHTALACAAGGSISTFIFIAVIVTFGAVELRRASASPEFGVARHRAITWLVFALIAVATVAMTSVLSPQSWVYLYLLVAVFDGFSQVVGQLVGSRRLAPRLSPGKTVEGAIGGLVAAVLVGVYFRHLVGLDTGTALMITIAITAAGLSGDLAASSVKRRAGIKDFGTALPGQGGVLDRFDSFLAASAIVGPVIYLTVLT